MNTSTQHKPRFLVTGFSPFEGRSVNSSWIAAQNISQRFSDLDLEILELPVVWGEPARIFTPRCQHNPPDVVLSKGEGKPGHFTIETVTRNIRKHRMDNNSAFPPTATINQLGKEQYQSSAPFVEIQRLMAEKFPIVLSQDAGNFLCEETLYTLEELKSVTTKLQLVIFAHLPPFGTPLEDGTITDERLVGAFAEALINATLPYLNYSKIPARQQEKP